MNVRHILFKSLFTTPALHTPCSFAHPRHFENLGPIYGGGFPMGGVSIITACACLSPGRYLGVDF